ncbi:MAG TPA: ECF-type sigma factor [Fimbriiglobus sp.]|jgi:RNA polymerase sigma factor (TIGR02999 family)
MTEPNHSSDVAPIDPSGAGDLLALVYDELRTLAAVRLAAEPAGHTLQPTALVHEVYLKLADRSGFPDRSQFLAAAVEAMRRVLVDHARRKRAVKRGGDARRLAVDPDQFPGRNLDPDDLISLDEALTRFAAIDPIAARVAALRVFTGLSVEEAGDTLGLPRASAYRDWAYARAWLTTALSENLPPS